MSIEEDLVEEVIRIYGYNNIPALTPTSQDKMIDYPNNKKSIYSIKSSLVNLGYNEVVSYSFIDKETEEKLHSNLDVIIKEPDVSPVQLQGPKSGEIMAALFGEDIAELKYYWLRELDLDGIPLVVSRTGWSSELGYELYLQDGSRGDELWEKIMATGKPLGLKPGHTSTIRRIEGGMLSYHADADISTNPYELGFDRLVSLDIDANFIGKTALKRIQNNGISRKQIGLIIGGDPLLKPNTSFWPIKKDGIEVGKVTSAVYSPRLKQNIALAIVAIEHTDIGSELDVTTSSGRAKAKIVERPFYDPKKQITAA